MQNKNKTLFQDLPKLILGVSLIAGLGLIVIALTGRLFQKQNDVPLGNKDNEEIVKERENNYEMELVKNTSYLVVGQKERTVDLIDGSFIEENSLGKLDVKIFENKIAFGALGENNGAYAAVILDVSENINYEAGGSDYFHSYRLAILKEESGKFVYVDSVYMGDREKMEKLSIDSGKVVVSILVHGPEDALCCPTLEDVVKYELINGKLQKYVPVKTTVCPSEGDLSVLNNSSYPYNKARITSKKGDRGGSVSFPHRTFAITDSDFVLEGVNRPDANRVTIEWDGNRKINDVQNFKSGDTHWCFDINDNIGNIKPGVNIYTVKLFFDKNEIIEYGVQVIYDKFSDVITDDLSLSIEWLPELKKEPVEKFFSKEILDNFYTDCNSELPCYDLFSFFNAGKVRTGKYKDLEYILVARTFIGHGEVDSYYRTIFNPTDKKLILLKKYSNEPSGEDKPFFAVAENLKVENLLPPLRISIPNTDYSLEAHEESPNILFSDMINIDYYEPKKMFTDPVAGDVYIDDHNKTFFVRVADGSLKIYRIGLPFVKLREKSDDWNYDDLLLDITFNDGKRNTENYFYGSRYQYVCAGGSMYDIVSEEDLKSKTDLVFAGASAQGEKFYEFKSDRLQTYYKNNNGLSGVAYSFGENMTFEEFSALHPFLYWKDPFGRWIQFTNNRFSPMLECGGGVGRSAI